MTYEIDKTDAPTKGNLAIRFRRETRLNALCNNSANTNEASETPLHSHFALQLHASRGIGLPL